MSKPNGPYLDRDDLIVDWAENYSRSSVAQKK